MLLFLFTLGCDGFLFRTAFEDVEDAILYEADEIVTAPAEKEELLILNYNIKYGGARLTFFWECNGERYNMTENEVTVHLDNIVEFINEVNPDILILQEVDRQSQRSVYIDQTQYLLDRTELNYGAYASQHKADFLPSDGMGPLDFGNSILSKWPISKGTRISLPLMRDQPAYYTYFYLKRHILTAEIDLPWKDNFVVVNTHLEAFSDDGTKKRQIDKLHSELTRLTDEGKDWVMGGDLNSLPKGSEVLSGFPDDCPGLFDPDDYSGEEDWLDSLFTDFNSAMTLVDYEAQNSRWYSYTGNTDFGWTRTLDYMFTNGDWVDYNHNYVIQSLKDGGYETLPLSDHAPIHTIWSAQ